MLLSTAESGHPTRCGFGKSRDRPLASRSNIRFSSRVEFFLLRSELACSQMKSCTKTGQVYREDRCKPTSAMQQSRSAAQPGTQLAYCITKSKFGLRFRQVQMYCDFPPGVSVLPSRPYFAGPLIHPSHGFVDLDRLLQIVHTSNHEPVVSGQGHR